MATSWYMKYIPRNIDEYVFPNKQMKKIVNKWLENEEIDGNVLLYGPGGIGKTSLIRILVKNLIKSESDFKEIDGRKIDAVDNLYYFIMSEPSMSKKKIVLIEEFDRLSTKAQTELKRSYLERFQNTCSFICTTNRIDKIDSALISRFNYKFDMTPDRNDREFIDSLVDRILFILKNEGYNNVDRQKIENIILSQRNLNIRNIISKFEIVCKSNDNAEIDWDKFDNLDFSYEEEVFELTIELFNKFNALLKKDKRQAATVIYNIKTAEDLFEEYKRIISITRNNTFIDYSSIFSMLVDRIKIIPLLVVTEKYSREIEDSRYKWITYLAYVSEILIELYKLAP